MSTSHPESFQNFFNSWLVEQNQYLNDLIFVAENPGNNNGVDRGPVADDDVVGSLVERVIQHYEHYYEVKSHWVKQDALGMLRPSWRSSLEDSYMWLGGWRPTMAFHLLYSKSGLQLEAHLPDFIQGLPTGNLADLSSNQIKKIDSSHRRTVREEKEITEKMAKYQEMIAEPSMVELSHVATKAIMEGEGESREFAMEERLRMTLERKENDLKEIVQMADELRLKTLKGIFGIMTKRQTIYFLIAAAELHLRIHEWGMQRDARQQR